MALQRRCQLLASRIAAAVTLTCYVWSAGTYAFAQGLNNTSQTSVLLRLGPETATQPNLQSMIATTGPVNLTFVYPNNGVDSELPWIMLMSGANCYSQDYSFLMNRMAGMGYLVAIADQLHPNPPGVSFVSPVKEPQCSNSSYSVPTASILNDVHSVLASSDDPNDETSAVVSLPPSVQRTIGELNLNSVVLLSHSLGGIVSTQMLSGACQNTSQPYCSDYTKILDSNASDIIKGVVMFEGGYESANGLLEISDDYFLTYLACRDYANETAYNFEHTDGQCLQYIELSSGNHYAVTNWNPNTAPYQKAPCGWPASGSDYMTTESEQEARLIFFSQLIDADIRAQVLNDTSAISFLTNQAPDSPFVDLTDLASDSFGCAA